MSQRMRVLLILLVATLPLFLLGAALLVRNAMEVQDQVRSDRAGLARAAAVAAGAFIEGDLNTVGTIAADLAGAAPEDADALQQRLGRILRANPQWFGISIVKSDGWNLIGSESAPNTVYIGDRPYFRQALETGQPVVSPAVIGRISGLPTVIVAVPLPLAGDEPGVLIAALPTERLAASLHSALGSPSLRIILVDDAGQIFVHPDETRVRALEPAGHRLEVQSAWRGEFGSLITDRNGTDTLVAFAPVERTGWAVLVAEPTSTAFAPVRARVYYGLGVIGAGLLVVLAIGWWLGGRLARSYERLDQARIEASGARADAESAQQRYVDLVDGVDAIVWEADARNFQFTYVSNRAEEILGYPVKQWLGERNFWADHIHPDDREHAVRYCIECTTAGADHSFEYRAIATDGRIVWLADVVRVVKDEAGEPALLRGVMIDITGRKRAEEERSRLLAAEHLAREQAESALRSRDEFLSIASHELRNPVAAIKGTGQLMRRLAARGRIPDDTVREYAETIVRTSDRLTRLVDDLLDVARLRSGHFDLRLEPTDLAALVSETAADVPRDWHGPKIEIEGVDTPRPALVDADRIRQILQNLLDNAIKYSPGGGVTRVSLVREDDGVRIDVSDEGIGLPVDEIERVFEPFGRASNATKENIAGMGLGLYICRQLAQAHGGELRASSPGPGRGTTFSLALPAAVLGDSPEPESTELSDTPTAAG